MANDPSDPTGATDANLLRSAQTSAAAFRRFYDRHADRVFGFFVRRTHDPTAAVELTAETFAQAWIGRARFADPGDGNAGPWLFGIARNLLASAVRRRAVDHAARDRLGLTVDRASAEPSAAWLVGLDADLADALGTLSADHRRAVELRFLEDRRYDDVAATLGISQGAARVRVHRGLAQLRRRLTAN